MAEPILTYELKNLLNKIKEELVNMYPIQVITPNYLLLAILENQSCEGYILASRVMMSSSMNEFKNFIIENIQSDCLGSPKLTPESVFSDVYENMAVIITNQGFQVVTSANMLVAIISHDIAVKNFLEMRGVTIEQLNTSLIEMTAVQPVEDKPKKIKKKKPSTETTNTHLDYVTSVRVIPEENNIVESTCINMVRLAANGEYKNVIGFSKEIDFIFDVLGKYDRNTVAIVGERGVGKTSLTQQLANVLYSQNCPVAFKDKYLIKFQDQISSIIIDEMNRQGKYIALIDDIERLFSNKDAEANNMFVLTELFKSPNICTIITINDVIFSKTIEAKPEFARYMQKLKLEPPTGETLNNIIRNTCSLYESYNNVKFSDSNINESIRLANRFFTIEKCPRSALNILDATGSYVRMRSKEDEELVELRTKLANLDVEINNIQASGSAEDFDRKDNLIRDKISIQQRMSLMEQNTSVIEVSDNDIKAVVSEMTNIPMSEMASDEKEKLKTLKTNLNTVVIGQDNAIDDICRAVKRQRVGLANPNKPCVMLFVGTTGTGKSFLAKRLAYEMFGDEKNMVRLDMSEYSEKTSVTKLYGTAPGYIGYEEGGILTEAIKRKNRCVLLLDEIEKAHEDVYNVLLQVFDEGRLTDNKGTLVDFKNVIIIMTSNVGAKNVTDKVTRIGFGKQDENLEDKEIILKSIKKEFKPEFINRIDNICYFNKLSDDNLKIIIKNEIKNVQKKVIELGYDMDDELMTGRLVDSIFNKVKEEAEYGARPILREIQRQLEDKLTDYIIENSVKPGHIFTYDNIY